MKMCIPFSCSAASCRSLLLARFGRDSKLKWLYAVYNVIYETEQETLSFAELKQIYIFEVLFIRAPFDLNVCAAKPPAFQHRQYQHRDRIYTKKKSFSETGKEYERE